MSRYTTIPIGFNNSRHSHIKPTEDPAPEVILSGPRAAVVHLVDINSYYAAVLVEDEWFVGRDAFPSSEDALMVAKARARMEEADGHR